MAVPAIVDADWLIPEVVKGAWRCKDDEHRWENAKRVPGRSHGQCSGRQSRWKPDN